MKAAVVTHGAAGKIALAEISEPIPADGEALIRVTAVSLNRGEVRMAQSAAEGGRVGWDFAGVVEAAARDNSGPKNGARVVGLMKRGAWAEKVAVETTRLAELPDGITDAQAATLPVAGLSAYHALKKGGLLLGKPVLITGATGGVGDFALRLAKLSGAKVVAQVRKPEQEAQVRSAGAEEVVVGDITANYPFGKYWLIVESVGGETLAQALESLNEGGTIVTLGTSGGDAVTFNAQKFYNTGTTTLYGFILADEFTSLETAGDGLLRLAQLVADGKLTPNISLREDWNNIGNVAQSLLDRTYAGKAVLTVAGNV